MSRAPQEWDRLQPSRSLTTRRHLGLGLLVGFVLAGLARAGEWVGGGRPEVPLEGDGSTWLVRATINGRVTGLFLLDTGSTFCVISRDTSKRLSLPSTGETVTVQTANGNVRAPIVRLADVDIGGARVGGVDAVIRDNLPDNIDGMVGLSFLNRFSYSIDPRRRTLRLR